MFYDTNDFPFTKKLEAHWRDVRAEFETIDPDHLLEAPWEAIYNKAWEVYTLYALEHKFKQHCAKSPKTTALIENIPGLYNAGFSVIGPGTHITPHEGYTSDVLRCHLGIIVPDPNNCAIRVGDQTYHWHEGECMIFDDMVEHEAWNNSDKIRVVLIMDILKSSYEL